MASQNDQHSDTPTDEPNRLPLKKRGHAAKTLPGLNNGHDWLFPLETSLELNELKINAYYDVLMAFLAESSAISGPRIMIIKELKKELKIDQKTHTNFVEQIKSDPFVQKLRGASLVANEKETEKVTDAEEQKSTSVPKPRLIVDTKDVLKLQESLNVAPAKIQQETAEPNATTTPEGSPLPNWGHVSAAKSQDAKAESATTTTTPEDLPFPSWGHVSPESLVNNFITIRIDGQDDYLGFLIKAYDAETEMHQLVTVSGTKEHDDPLDWIDIRYFPREDIIWQYQHPGFTTRNRLLKPGQTILNATTTARKKTLIKEVGKAASGIPIIKKLDKGKAKVL